MEKEDQQQRNSKDSMMKLKKEKIRLQAYCKAMVIKAVFKDKKTNDTEPQNLKLDI